LYPALAQTVQLVTGNGRFRLKTVARLSGSIVSPLQRQQYFRESLPYCELYPSEIVATVTNKTDLRMGATRLNMSRVKTVAIVASLVRATAIVAASELKVPSFQSLHSYYTTRAPLISSFSSNIVTAIT
jgi:hypothetical protein